MKAFLWSTFAAATVLASPQGTVLAQRNSAWPMMVVIRMNDGKDAWQFAPRMASATSMQLVGVSVSTNTAVFTVPNETDKGQGIVAQRNQKTIMDGFPGVVQSFNYGVNYPDPKDLQNSPPVVVVDRGRPDDNRGRPDDNRGRPDDNRGWNNRRGPPNRFTDRDRAAVRDWYYDRRDAWWQIREGNYLNARQIELSYPVPPELARQLGPVYRGGSYLVIGDNLVMVDNRNYILDVIHFWEIRDDRRR